MAPVFESIWIFNSKGLKLLQLPQIIEKDPIDRFINGLYLFAIEMGDRRIKSITLEKSAFCVITVSINEIIKKSSKFVKKTAASHDSALLDPDIDIIFVGKIHSPEQEKQDEMISNLEKISKIFMKLDIEFTKLELNTLYFLLDKLDPKKKQDFFTKAQTFLCK